MTGQAKRIAWVTGGGSGIGQTGAEALAADGWTVAISGRRGIAALWQWRRTDLWINDSFPHGEEAASQAALLRRDSGRLEP